MTTNLGISLVCDRISELASWVGAVEEAGFERLGLGDSPAALPDTYVQSTVAALNSQRLKLGPRVTTPINRDPLATVAAISTIDELSGGRCFLGIGTGHGAPHGAGVRPATLAQTNDYISALKDLFCYGSAVYRGQTMSFTRSKRPVPIYLAASGPKSLRLAGATCDGVIVGWGIEPRLVTLALQYIEEGATSIGRKIADIDIWWLIYAGVASSKQEALGEMKPHLPDLVGQAMRTRIPEKGIPSDLVPRVERFVHGYNHSIHQTMGNVQLMESLDLVDYFADRFAIIGSADEFVERVRQLRAWGARQLWLTVPTSDKLGFIRVIRDHVIPQL